MNTRKTPPRRVEENEVQEEIPPKVEEVEQVPQNGEGVEDSHVPTQCDHIPNVEGGNEVSLVHLDLTNQVIREALPSLR